MASGLHTQTAEPTIGLHNQIIYAQTHINQQWPQYCCRHLGQDPSAALCWLEWAKAHVWWHLALRKWVVFMGESWLTLYWADGRQHVECQVKPLTEFGEQRASWVWEGMTKNNLAQVLRRSGATFYWLKCLELLVKWSPEFMPNEGYFLFQDKNAKFGAAFYMTNPKLSCTIVMSFSWHVHRPHVSSWQRRNTH